MHVWILVCGKSNYSALVLRKINMFLAGYYYQGPNSHPAALSLLLFNWAEGENKMEILVSWDKGKEIA